MNPRAVMGGLYLLVGLSLVLGLALGPRAAGPTVRLPGDVVGMVRVEGPITGSGGDGLFTAGASAERVVSDLRRAAQDPRVRAVVLRVNSPGGSAAASDEIGRAVADLREAGVPVVVSMGDLAASGGYWISCFADQIVASPATVTGSIGVIFQHANMEQLFDLLGIDTETIKSGQHKDMGSADRALTDAERAILQAMVDDIFDQFVEVVSTGRELDRERVLELADGRIFTGRQAQQLGLVDQLGTLTEAQELAAQLAGLDSYRVQELSGRWPHQLLPVPPWGRLDLAPLLRLITPGPGL